MEAIGPTLGSVGTGLSTLTRSSAVGTGIQTGLSATSALMSMMAGRAQQQQSSRSAAAAVANTEALAARARAQAELKFFVADETLAEADLSRASAEIEGSLEYLAGQQQAVRLQEDLNRTLSKNVVAHATSGVDAFSGSAARRSDAMAERGARDIDVAETNANLKALGSLIKASAITRQASGQAMATRAEGNQLLVDAGNVAARGQGDAAAALAGGDNAMMSGVVRGLSQLAQTGLSVARRK